MEHWGPVIAAVRDFKGLDKALDAPVATVFLLTGTILNIRDLVKVCRQRQKRVLVHLDFLSGVSVDEAGVQFLAKIVQPDGIISTHRAPLAAAKKSGLYTVQRFFLIDSLAVKSIHAAGEEGVVDMVEVMPGIASTALRDLCNTLPVPVIAGGLIRTKEELRQTLAAGVRAVSTSEPSLWTAPFS